ncbi:MAG: hypothetical protein Q9218_005424 [Villophora microphyllina]
MDRVKPENKLLRNVSNASARGSFLERRLSILTTGRSTTEPGDQVHGSLGLNLLYEPSEAIGDFIFVHGLRGGSRKTWSHSEDPSLFWPKEWLPTEPKFRHIRIHSYGYNADWGEKKGSVLNIQDFGSALLGEINISPQIRGGAGACILAKHDPNYRDLSSRFHTIYFLATPHRGADSAQLLNRMMKASLTHNAKDYINDLIPNSGAIQAINDDFRHISQDLRLWSFYETVKTNLGMSQALIVEKDSSVLGNYHLL